MKTLKKLSCLFLMTVIVAVSIFSLISTPKYAEATGLVPLYSFTRNDSGAHYFTALESERSTIQSTNFWRADGVVGYVYDYQVNNSSPLYRFYNYTNGDYTYVTTEIERSNLLSQNSAWWRYEGVVGYISTYQYNNLLPLYRFTSSFDVNKHIYTFLESERLNLLSNRYVWIDGGVVGYISANNNYSCLLYTSPSPRD